MKTRAEYNILDFLKDDSFLRSVLLLTDDDVEFWDNYVLENPEKKQEIEAAKQLLSSMTFDDETYSEQERAGTFGACQRSSEIDTEALFVCGLL